MNRTAAEILGVVQERGVELPDVLDDRRTPRDFREGLVMATDPWFGELAVIEDVSQTHLNWEVEISFPERRHPEDGIRIVRRSRRR